LEQLTLKAYPRAIFFSKIAHGCLEFREKRDGGRQMFNAVPVSVSARHVHLCKEHIEILFGKGFQLNIEKELSQPGQFAAKEKVSLLGPNGVINNVRVLGPSRSRSQVEVSITDCYKLGISSLPPIRDSGDLRGSSPITIVGPNGSVHLKEGLIIPSRHIHMSESDAEFFQVRDGEIVAVVCWNDRKTIFGNVKIRVSNLYRLEFHIDTDEANAAKLNNADKVAIVKKNDLQQVMNTWF
jgi:putative phosphotransacetylase